MANNISKKVGSSVRADEVGWEGLKKNPKADADAALLDLGLGGGVSKPNTVFVNETTSWTIYTVTSTDDDDKPGIYCLAVIDVPRDSMGLKIKYCYVKNNGDYGRVKWFPSYRLDDDERAAGRVEIQFGPLRPNSRIDIVRLVAVKRAAKDVGNPALDEDDRRGKGTTQAYAPETLPLTGGINAYWGAYAAPFANRIRFTSGPNALATILTGDYIISSPRILAVGSPKKEVDGVYYPVTFGTTDGAELLMASLRLGIYRVGTKAGGINTYSKRIPVPRYDLTEEDRTTLDSANQLTIDVGPLKANKRFHIKWARGRYSLDPDDSGAKTIRVRHPLESMLAGVDVNLDYLPDGIVKPGDFDYDINDTLLGDIPGNDGAGYPVTGDGPQLGVLAPTGDITDPPSNPNASDIITNEPDDATEKDKDAIIVLRVWAAEGNRAKYLIDPADPTMVTWSEANVNRAAVVIKTLLKDGVTYKQRRHAEDIDDPDAVFVDIAFHRRINKDLVWVKNVSLNEADREFSTTVDLAFVAGDTGSISDIATFDLQITQDGDDNRQAIATLTIANGTVSGNAAVPKRVVILRGKDENDNTDAPNTLAEINDGNTKWRPVFKKNLRADSDVLADVGTHTLTYSIPGVTAAKGIRYYRAFLFVVGDATWIDDFDDNTGGADSVSMPITETPSAAAAGNIVRSVCVGDPADGIAEVTFSVYANVAGTISFEDAYVDTISLTITNPDDVFRPITITATPEKADTNMLITHQFKLGKSYTWTEVRTSNSTSEQTNSSGSIAFVAGGGTGASTTNAFSFDAVAGLVSPAITVTAIDARHSNVEIEFDQPASLPVLLKKLIIEVKDNAAFTHTTIGTGASNTEDAGTKRAYVEDLLQEAAIYSAASADFSPTGFNRTIKHKKNQTVYARAILIPFGSNRTSATTRVTAQASLPVTDDNVALATAISAAPTNVIAKFKHGNLRLKCKAPTTGEFRNIMNYHWMVTDSATATSTTADFLDVSDDDNSDGLETVENSTDNPTANRIISGGPSTSIPVKKSVLTGLGSTIYVHVAIENNIGTSTNVATLAITTANLVSGVYNDDENIPVRRQFHGRGNLIDGGGCFNSALQFADPDNPGPLATELGRNVRIAIGGTRVSTSSTPVSWTKNIHAITIATGASTATFFWRMKGQLVAGHKVALSFLYRLSAALAMTADTSFSMKATLVNSAGTELLPAPGYVEIVLGYDTGGSTVELPWSTTFQTGVGLIELDANPNTQLWLKLYDIPQFATRSLIFDDICVVRGTVPALWEPGQKEHYLDPDSGITVASTGYTNTLNGAGLGSDGITAGGILTL